MIKISKVELTGGNGRKMLIESDAPHVIKTTCNSEVNYSFTSIFDMNKWSVTEVVELIVEYLQVSYVDNATHWTIFNIIMSLRSDNVSTLSHISELWGR